MNIEESLNKLFSLHTFGIKLGLENIQNFLTHLGNPQKSLKTIHVAGSNGKGSTSSFIASILMENDCKVGLYTSPHFVKFNERISVDGEQISDGYIANFVERNQKFIDYNKLTFFEVTTALAFEYFLSSKVDFAVIETGLGGRLDATNVLEPLACVITSISLEHTNILGNKIEEIAFEKGEIIKAGAKTFIGLLPEEAISVIEKKCNKIQSQLFCLEEYINQKNDQVELYTEELDFDDWEVPLQGKYQKYNAALASLTVVKTFGIDDPLVITKGVKNVIENTKLQGRYETVLELPKLILDSAHNPEGINCFLNEFRNEKSKYKENILLFGVMHDKNIENMLTLLKDSFDKIYFTYINYERSASIKQLKEISDKINLSFLEVKDLKEFLYNYLQGNKNNCLVVTGSMYLLGDVKSILKEIES
jgi:dihydrofolate synthase/folylpolyglutamate synthase